MKKIIIINFIILFSIILILEFSFNFFKLSGLMGIQSGIIDKNDKLHFFIPNSSGIIFDKKIFIDKHGFRVPSKDFEYKGEKNIFLLGDSATFGNGVLEKDTFAGLLRKNFTNTNFYNSSVPGYQIKHHIINLGKINNFQRVEKIIYFFTLNDVLNSANITGIKKLEKTSEGSHQLKKIKIFRELNNFLRNKSYLYMYIKGKFTDPSKRWFLNTKNFYIKNDLYFLNNYLLKLKEFSDNINAELYVVILPYEYQTRSCTDDNLLPQTKLKKTISKLNLNLSDYTNYFCTLDNPSNYFYKFDPMHLSEKGHKLVYNNIVNEINF